MKKDQQPTIDSHCIIAGRMKGLCPGCDWAIAKPRKADWIGPIASCPVWHTKWRQCLQLKGMTLRIRLVEKRYVHEDCASPQTTNHNGEDNDLR